VSLATRIYGASARYRRAWLFGHPSRVRRLGRPVVSIGSLSAGGSGKTPVAALVARLLLDAGERPAILSRGYARTAPDDGVTVVSDGVRLRADLARAGDEPLMLARALPGVAVVVASDRYLAGKVAELHLGATVHVLDDGFQHLVLARDVDLLIVDPADVDRPRLLPRGRLREGLGAARYADAVLVGNGAMDTATVADRLGVHDSFLLARVGGAPIEETPEGPMSLAHGTRVVAVSGIARPERFEQEAREQGVEVSETLRFRDHHAFTGADIGRISARLRETGASVVLTTEKDLTRLLIHRPWPFRLAVLPWSVHVDPERAFASWLAARLALARTRAGIVA
jgi:tetraacyldisaccharide 4'-kinase